MNDTVTLVDYYYTMVPDKVGEGARILGALRDAGVNLLAFTGFPEGRAVQLDFVPADAGAFVAAAKAAKVKLSRPQKALLISGDDRTGAMADVHAKRHRRGRSDGRDRAVRGDSVGEAEGCEEGGGGARCDRLDLEPPQEPLQHPSRHLLQGLPQRSRRLVALRRVAHHCVPQHLFELA